MGLLRKLKEFPCWIAFILIFTCTTILFYAFENIVVLTVQRAALGIIGFTCSVILYRATILSYREDANNNEFFYSLAWFLVWVGITLEALWLYLWRIADEPFWMVNSFVIGSVITLIILGGVLQLGAPELRHGRFPNQIRTGLFIGMLIVAALAAVGHYQKQEIKDGLTFLRRYLSEAQGPPQFLRNKERHE